MSSPLDDNDESEDVDDEFGDEEAVAEVFAWGSVVARTYCFSWTSSSSLSGSMALYSKASEGFGGGPEGVHEHDRLSPVPDGDATAHPVQRLPLRGIRLRRAPPTCRW